VLVDLNAHNSSQVAANTKSKLGGIRTFLATYLCPSNDASDLRCARDAATDDFGVRQLHFDLDSGNDLPLDLDGSFGTALRQLTSLTSLRINNAPSVRGDELPLHALLALRRVSIGYVSLNATLPSSYGVDLTYLRLADVGMRGSIDSLPNSLTYLKLSDNE
jgi:hypothetical protein